MWVTHALRQDVVGLACLPFSRRLKSHTMESEVPGMELNTLFLKIQLESIIKVLHL